MIKSECYYEEPYAGKLHVRFCIGACVARHLSTKLGDIARIIGIECLNEKIYFTLNREVNYYANCEYKNSNRIFIDAIDKHSNILNDLVKVGDIANGHKIIKIENGIFFYGYWGNERISGKITELQSRNDYIKHSFRTF